MPQLKESFSFFYSWLMTYQPNLFWVLIQGLPSFFYLPIVNTNRSKTNFVRLTLWAEIKRNTATNISLNNIFGLSASSFSKQKDLNEMNELKRSNRRTTFFVHSTTKFKQEMFFCLCAQSWVFLPQYYYLKSKSFGWTCINVQYALAFTHITTNIFLSFPRISLPKCYFMLKNSLHMSQNFH